MTAIMPWSLERLLGVAHPGEAIRGTIKAKNEKYDVELRTSRCVERGDFTYLNAAIEMHRARENIFSAEQVHKLTSRYGGEESLRVMLSNGFDALPYTFFDISIDDGEIRGDECLRILRLSQGEFTPRPLLRDICSILNLHYEERQDSFYLQQEQQPVLTPDTIKEAYRRMQKSGYFPSLSCSSPDKGFSVHQFSAPEGVHQTLSIHIGQPFPGGESLTTEKISTLQKTLLEYCPALPTLNYTWRTETAKDLEGWDECSMGP